MDFRRTHKPCEPFGRAKKILSLARHARRWEGVDVASLLTTLQPVIQAEVR